MISTSCIIHFLNAQFQLYPEFQWNRTSASLHAFMFHSSINLRLLGIAFTQFGYNSFSTWSPPLWSTVCHPIIFLVQFQLLAALCKPVLCTRHFRLTRPWPILPSASIHRYRKGWRIYLAGTIEITSAFELHDGGDVKTCSCQCAVCSYIGYVNTTMSSNNFI